MTCPVKPDDEKCPDLNLDEVEGETGEAIEQATAAVARADGDSRND